MSQRRQALGRRAEESASALLRDKGYRVLERNFRCSVGEIDIIASDGDTLVFVEVRSRHDARHGTALETVSPTKQRRIAKVAQIYLSRHAPAPCRFDVVGITGDEVVHIVDAFRLS